MYSFSKETDSIGKSCTKSATVIKFKDPIILTQCSVSQSQTSIYGNIESNSVIENNVQVTSCIENVAIWFLNKSSISHKKLQKLCYYAYCWFIIFFNDIEVIDYKENISLHTLCKEKFQAWIHGPVCPELYQQYKKFGWQNIPQKSFKPNFNPEIESLLNKVWKAYGNFTADELESLSHSEAPWINARKGTDPGDACCNEISPLDILEYFSSIN